MEWLNPSGWWAWLGLGVILALYFLRRKSKQHQVPSLLLWQRMECLQEAQRPFQRLRKQWLLILQLLLAALLTMAILRPVGIGGLHGETVLIFDVSASMQTESSGQSRIREAVLDALTLVEGMQEGDRMTLLTAGQSVGQPITRSSDKQKLKAALSALEAENGGGDLEGALSLAMAMKRDLPEMNIIVYSDQEMMKGAEAQLRAVGQGESNRSVISLRCGDTEEGMSVFARIANEGLAARVVLECYADGNLCDVRTLEMAEGEQQNVRMQLPMQANVVWVELITADALAADNIRYWVRQEPSEYKALLVTGGNVFLEKALSLREDINLYKADTADGVSLEGYDLYLFDGDLPGSLPQTGSVLAIAPKAAVGTMQVGAESSAQGRLRAGSGALSRKLTQNLLLSEISLRTYRPLQGGQSILTWGEDVLLSVEDTGGRRMAALGFDLHDSNLPMKADFPILMQNLLEFLVPRQVAAVEGVSSGQSVTLALDERTETAKMILPSGRETPVEGSLFTQTGEIGVYTLWETRAEGKERITPFALHMPLSESDVRHVAASATPAEGTPAEGTPAEGTPAEGTPAEGTPAEGALAESRLMGIGREWTPLFLLACIILLMVEWEVSRRGA